MDRVQKKPVGVVVSVADDHLDDLTGVVERLRRAGLLVDDVLDAVGVITGRVAADDLDALESVPGVVQVERDRAFQLPPPDAEIQ
jgi:hypothetical protein